MLFSAEEALLRKYQEYLASLGEGEGCSREALLEMVDGYARILRQLRTLTKLSDRTTETLHNSQQELMHKVRHDALTGVYSRRYMGDKLLEYAQSCRGAVLCLMMIDVDLFKKYNDYYGHPQGDACLKQVAGALSQRIANTDGFVARCGGEEFAVVLPHVSVKKAQSLAEQLSQAVAKQNIPHHHSSVASHVTVSIGCVTGVLGAGWDPEKYIEAADKALYQSKLAGRNCVTFVEL